MDYSLLIIGFFVFFITIILCKVLIHYSASLKLLDVPNERSLHTLQKSRAGGIAIFSAFILGLLSVDFIVDFYVVVAFFIVFFLGLYDDRFGSSSKIKIFWLIITSFFLYIGDMYIKDLGVFLGYEIELPLFLTVLFTIFAIVGFVNAMNLIDGLDGLSSGVGLVILISFFYLGYKYQDAFLLYLSFFLILSLLAFLFYNWYPSILFMGDTGSLTLGFVIAVLAIHSVNHEYITPVTVLLLTAVPILDTLVVMARRIRRGKNPFSPDKTHIHHILLKQHYGNVAKTTKILILTQMVFTYIGLGFKVRDDLVILVIFILLFVLFYLMLTPKKIRKNVK